jgi:hypothetical protein
VTQHVVSGSTTDRYNNTTPTFTDKAQKVYAEFPAGGQSFIAHESDGPAGDTALANLVLIVPADISVTPTDEWTATDGMRYRTMGPPQPYRHPQTGTAVTQVNLRRIF